MSSLEAITAANNLFTVDLARQMNGDQNVVLSSLSIFVALALICLGAEDKTEDQMRQVLYFEDCRNIHYGIQSLMLVLQGTNDYKLDIQNTLFVEETCEIPKDYINISNVWYNYKPEKVNFKNAPKEAWEHINSWLKEESKGTFQNMSETLMTNNTKAVVVNMGYLLANWTQSFPKVMTSDGYFTMSNDTVVPIQMMSVLGKFNYQTIDDEKLSILELPYGKTKDLCMYVVLPDTNKDLYKVVQNMTYEKLNTWTDTKYMKQKYTKVYFPHFQLHNAYSMKGILSKMGMPDMFNDTKARFTGISQDNFFVSDVISLATVMADEDGTKDVTDIDDHFGFLFSVLPQVIFTANHPFCYYIKHKPTNSYVFYGTFQIPEITS